MDIWEWFEKSEQQRVLREHGLRSLPDLEGHGSTRALQFLTWDYSREGNSGWKNKTKEIYTEGPEHSLSHLIF